MDPYDLLRGDYPITNKLQLLYQLDRGDDLGFGRALQLLSRNVSELSQAKVDDMGTFGNVHIRKLYFPTASTIHDGHRHSFDHVSFLVSGRVRVEVEGFPPKEYSTGSIIMIRGELFHKITALEDETVWLCISTAADFDDNYLDDMYTKEQDPIAL